MPFISLLYLSSISKSLLFESLGRDFAFQYSLPLCIFISKTRYSSNFFLNVSFPSANCILLLKTRLSTPYLLLLVSLDFLTKISYPRNFAAFSAWVISVFSSDSVRANFS